MYKQILVLGALGGALAVGCGDDDSGGSAGGGGMTSGGTAGSDGTGGGDSGTGGGDGGTGGGDSTGGTGGGDAQTCADYCAYVAELGCEDEVEEDCVDGCNEALELCPSETEALYVCLLEQPLSDYVCDEFDEVTLDSDACDGQANAFFECIL